MNARSNPVALTMAVLGPLVVLAVFVGVISAETTAEPSAIEKQFDKLRAASPEVVLLGNSKVGADVNAAGLGQRLGVGVASFGIAGTMGNTWYTVLERQVFAKGLHPKLVVVYGVFRHMAISYQLSGKDNLYIEQLGGGQSAAIAAKVFPGTGGPAMRRARRRATEWRATLLEEGRDLGLGLLQSGTIAAQASQLEDVFGEKAVYRDLSQHRSVPVSEEEVTTEVGDATDVEATLLPDFVELAQQNGARIVFVRAPVAATASVKDNPSDELLSSSLHWLGDHQAGWADLRKVGETPGIYFDGVHMNSVGRGLMTSALADWLQKQDALGKTPFPLPTVPMTVAEIRRTGAFPVTPLEPGRVEQSPCGYTSASPIPAALSVDKLLSAGLTSISPFRIFQDGVALSPKPGGANWIRNCDGQSLLGARLRWTATDEASHQFTIGLAEEPTEGWWLNPGGALTFLLQNLRDQRVEVLVSQVDGGGGRLNGTPLAEVAPGVLRAQVPASESLKLEADGWLLVHRLSALGDADDLVGSAPLPIPLRTRRSNFSEAPKIEGERIEEGDLLRIDLPAWHSLESAELQEKTGFSDCSPIRVSEGATIIRPTTDKKAVRSGRFLHADGSVFLPNRPMEVFLNPARDCGLLYPGDHLETPFDGIATPTQHFGLQRLQLKLIGFPMGDTAAHLTIRLTSKEEILREWELDLPVSMTELELPVDPPLLLSGGNYRVTMDLQNGAMMLVSGGLDGPTWALRGAP